MAKVHNLQAVLRALEKLERESIRKNTGDVIVGFSASYALFVHENTSASHKNGQAKFLEEPARTKQGEIARSIREAMERKTAKGRRVSLLQALKIGGLRLQREAQKLTPVDTGNLKASAFTEEE
jgi:hypothetical protein